MNRRLKQIVLLCVVCAVMLSILVLPGPRNGEALSASASFPLRVSTNQRYLIDAQSRPFLITGDTAWSLGTNATLAEAAVYFANRKAKGFNTVLLNILDDSYGNLKDGTRPFQDNNNFDTRNAAYFDHFAALFQLARDNGFLVLAVPLYTGQGCGDCAGWAQEMRANSLTRLRNYGRYVAQRYHSYGNVLWVMGGDSDPGDDRARISEIAAGIEEISPDALMTAHTSSLRSAKDEYPTESWLDLNNNYVYSSNGTQVYVYSIKDYVRTPVMPFILYESAYENQSNGQQTGTPAMTRRQAYWSVLQGSTGQMFGNRPLWFHGDGWEAAMDSPGSRQAGLVGKLLNQRKWWLLVPDGMPDPAQTSNRTLVVAGHGTYCEGGGGDCGADYIAAARASDGSLALAYVPPADALNANPNAGSSRRFTVDMSRLSAPAIASWFNPNTGAYTALGTLPNTGTREFVTPGANGSGSNDWVLVLETSAPPPEPTDAPVPTRRPLQQRSWLPVLCNDC